MNANPPPNDDSLLLEAKERIDRVCLEFERAWKSGRQPQIEPYLGATPGPQRTVLLEELLLLDVDYRSHAGEQPAAAEYLARFPQDGKLIEDVFRRSSSPADDPPSGTEPPMDGDLRLDFLLPSKESGNLGRLGPYEITEVIGQGGMGVVLKGHDAGLNRFVAIKVPCSALASNAIARKRFLREARAAAAVSHDHVVTIHAVEQFDGLPYLVMEYVDGCSLQERIDRDGPLELKEILRIGMQIAWGLAAAHAQGVVHRDIKPANVLLENHVERVKISDFGLARAADDARLTQSGTVTGTPRYMSPEQAQGKAVDYRSDLFSFGSVLYTMCTGRPPFRATSILDAIRQVSEDTPHPIGELNCDVPDWLVEIIDKLMAKQPEDRFESADEVADLLEQHLAHLQQPGAVPRPPRPAKRVRPAIRRRWIIAGVVAALLLAVVVFTEAMEVTSLRKSLLGWSGLSWSGDRRTDGESPQPAPHPAHVQAAIPPAQIQLRGRGAIGVRWLPTLQQAVAAAGPGDLILIRQDGEIGVEPLQIRGKALTIRAWDGYRPVLVPPFDAENCPLIDTDAPLVLEGLVIYGCRVPPRASGPGIRVPDWPHTPPEELGTVIVCRGAPLYLANCRIFQRPARGQMIARSCIYLDESPECEVRNCLLLGSRLNAIGWNCPPRGRLIIRNTVGYSRTLVEVLCSGGPASLHLQQNTLLGNSGVHVWLPNEPQKGVLTVQQDVLTIQSSQNVLAFRTLLTCFPVRRLPPDDLAERLPEIMTWHDQKDLFVDEMRLVGLMGLGEGPPVFGSLEQWNDYWGKPDTGSRQAALPVNPAAQLTARNDPQSVRPQDFLLDGNRKDLGAEIGIVGPGGPYFHWRKTPAYRSWPEEQHAQEPSEATSVGEVPTAD